MELDKFKFSVDFPLKWYIYIIIIKLKGEFISLSSKAILLCKPQLRDSK